MQAILQKCFVYLKSNKEKNNEATCKHKNNDRRIKTKANRITMYIIWLVQYKAA